jgi:hypothetical protein
MDALLLFRAGETALGRHGLHGMELANLAHFINTRSGGLFPELSRGRLSSP